jgi:hypothetical protein
MDFCCLFVFISTCNYPTLFFCSAKTADRALSFFFFCIFDIDYVRRLDMIENEKDKSMQYVLLLFESYS